MWLTYRLTAQYVSLTLSRSHTFLSFDLAADMDIWEGVTTALILSWFTNLHVTVLEIARETLSMSQRCFRVIFLEFLDWIEGGSWLVLAETPNMSVASLTHLLEIVWLSILVWVSEWSLLCLSVLWLEISDLFSRELMLVNEECLTNFREIERISLRYYSLNFYSISLRDCSSLWFLTSNAHTKCAGLGLNIEVEASLERLLVEFRYSMRVIGLWSKGRNWICIHLDSIFVVSVLWLLSFNSLRGKTVVRDGILIRLY